MTFLTDTGKENISFLVRSEMFKTADPELDAASLTALHQVEWSACVRKLNLCHVYKASYIAATTELAYKTLLTQ